MEVAAELRGEGAVGLVYRLIDHSSTYIIVVTDILNFALFSYFTSNAFCYQLDPHLVPVIEYS